MPILQQPLAAHIGHADIDLRAFQQILDGTFQYPLTCKPITKCLLQQLAQPKEVEEHSAQTYEEFQRGWIRARETTASSPSGIHFGHYIAAMTNVTVAKLNAILVNLALLSSRALERWKKALNMMLEKLAGNDNVEKLCIIMLFKADFNNNNKWIGKQVMLTVEKHGLLALEQYGSRKSKAVGTQCLNK